MNKVNKTPKLGKIVNRSDAIDVVRSTQGRIFSVTFTKKDGTIRKLTGRLGVKKHLHGGKNTTAHISEYITVYDLHSKGYRNVNTNTISEVCFQNIVYLIK